MESIILSCKIGLRSSLIRTHSSGVNPACFTTSSKNSSWNDFEILLLVIFVLFMD
jgi:hypothetical protein